LNNAYPAAFFKVKIPNPISMRNKQVWTFSTSSQSLLLFGILILTIVSPASRPSKVYFPFVAA
jgi:hypothetical protein